MLALALAFVLARTFACMFCGMFINLIFAVSSQYAGAVATSEFLLYFDYFARKEWGDIYYCKPDVIINNEFSTRSKTIRKQMSKRKGNNYARIYFYTSNRWYHRCCS